MTPLLTRIREKEDPLSVLVAPHETFEWMVAAGILKRTPLFNYGELRAAARLEAETGKFAIYHGNMRLRGKPFGTEEQARARIDEIVGNKPACLKNYRIYSIKQL